MRKGENTLISPKIIPIRNLFVYAYLIADFQNLTLIDTGLPGSTKPITSALQTIGKQLSDLKTILITHSDGDHTGGINVLRKVSRAVVYASPTEAEAITAGRASRDLTPKGLEVLVYRLVGAFFDRQPATVDQLLQGGEVLPVLEGLQVYSTPGHTPGHLSYFLPEQRVLFSGDSIVTGAPAKPSTGSNTWKTDLARESFERQMALKPRWICGGHGIQEIRD